MNSGGSGLISAARGCAAQFFHSIRSLWAGSFVERGGSRLLPSAITSTSRQGGSLQNSVSPGAGR